MTPVDDFLANLTHPAKPLILELRRLILAADPAITEEIKWNAPSFRTTDNFATFQLRAKKGILLVLHVGSRPQTAAHPRDTLPPTPLPLDWRAHDRAVLTLLDLDDLARHRDALTTLIQNWLQIIPGSQAPQKSPPHSIR